MVHPTFAADKSCSVAFSRNYCTYFYLLKSMYFTIILELNTKYIMSHDLCSVLCTNSDLIFQVLNFL